MWWCCRGAAATGDTVVAEANTNSDSRGRPSTSASLQHLLLAAGSYTIEATTRETGATGEYSLWVQRWPADGCTRELGTLDAAVTVASGSGIIAQDAGCVSAARNRELPGSTYYARRHVFTLGGAATISISLSAANSNALSLYVVVLSGRSSDGSGTVVAEANTNLDSRGRPSKSASLRHLMLATGTYTIEATTTNPGDRGPTGSM